MSWTWIDWAFAAVLLISVLSGMAKGFIREGLGLLAWLAALIAARMFAGPAGEIFRDYVASANMRLAIGFVIVVFVVIVVSGMLIRFLDAVIEWAGMGRFNRLLGALFGALRGAAVLVLISAVVGLTPWREAPDWQQSQLRPLVGQARDVLMAHWDEWEQENAGDVQASSTATGTSG